MDKGSSKNKKRVKKDLKITEQDQERQKANKEVSTPGTKKPKPAMARLLINHLPSWYPLPLLMLVGILFRLSVTLWEPLIYPDSMQYMHLAREIHEKTFFEKDFDLDQGFRKSRRLPPLYPVLLALFAGTKADLEHVGTVISLFMSILAFIPFYLAASMIFSRRTAIISSALLSFHTFTLMYSSPVLSEATFTALYISVIAISTYCLVRPSLWTFALSGVLCSLLYMTRDVGITAALLIVLGALAKLGLIDRIQSKKLIGFITALVVSFLAVSSPYFIHIRIRTGHWGLTTQMSNTNVTRQIQLFGGERKDRDRAKKDQTGSRLLGDKPAQGVLDLVKISPALLAKLAKNMGSYGLELVRRSGTFVFPLIIVGLVGILRNYIRSRDKTRLFMQGWLVLWIIQLWSLYSLITPYMVDDRYIYPLMLPAIIIAGHGISTTSKWLKNKLEDENIRAGSAIYIQAIVFPMLLLFYMNVFSYCMEPILAPLDPVRRYIFPVAGLTVLYGLALVPGILLAFSSRIFSRIPDLLRTAIALTLLLFGLAAFWVPDPSPPLIKYLPGLFLTGAGFALAASLGPMRRLMKAEGFVFILPVIMVASAFVAQWPDFAETRAVRMTPWGISKKYSTGYKQIAGEIKAKDLVGPGKVICSRKPFIAYYLDGKWHPMPKTVNELIELIRSGSIDYLAANSATFKHIRPELTEIAYRINPLPGADIIYSKFLPDYHRIITVYDCRRPEQSVPDRGSPNAHLLAAMEFFKEGALPFAYRETLKARDMDPQNLEAMYLQLKILRTYYLLSKRKKIPTRIIAPTALSSMRQVAGELVRLDPDHPNSKIIIDEMKKINRREQTLLQKYKQEREEDP